MGGSRLALVALVALGCGRLGFDPLAAGDGDGDGDGDGGPIAAGLGESCDTNSCDDQYRCLLGICSCLQELKSDEFQTCTLEPDSSVSCVGRNTTGQLGRGTMTTSEADPAPVVGLPAAIVEIDLGAFHACARTDAGELWCWGQVDAEAATGAPYQVTVGEPVAQIASGGFHTCVRGESGAVYCFGRNADGQLGRGTTGGQEIDPAPVSGVADAVDVASGGFHSCAIRGGGAAVCWGQDVDGQVGDGAVGATEPTPVAVAGLTNVAQLSLGDFHSCARRDNGEVHCWGQNNQGQLGAGVVSPGRPDAAAVVNATGAVDLYTGDDSACAIDDAGEALCWGSNVAEHLIAGAGNPVVEAMAGEVVSGIQDLSIGRQHSCFLTMGADVVCAGTNSFGELGAGTMSPSEALGSSQLSCGP